MTHFNRCVLISLITLIALPSAAATIRAADDECDSEALLQTFKQTGAKLADDDVLFKEDDHTHVKPTSNARSKARSSVHTVSMVAVAVFILAITAICAFLSRFLSRAVLGLKREPTPLEEWIAKYEEDAVDPDLAILDAHHHLWDLVKHDKDTPAPKWFLKLLFKFKPWRVNDFIAQGPNAFSFGTRSPSACAYMPRELLDDIQGNGHGHNIVGTVYMECGWKTPDMPKEKVALEPCGEADMVAEVHRHFPKVCQALVAHADLRLGAAVEPALKYYHEKFKTKPMVRGIRHGLAWDEDERIVGSGQCDKDTAYSKEFREGLALLSKYGLHFETWCFHEQIDGVADLARTFPDTIMVLDHMGFPLGLGNHKLEESRPKWEASMKALAESKNVYVKIGGMGMRWLGFDFDERLFPPTSDELAKAWGPFITFTIMTFDVDRCLMESNFPMDKVSCSYTVLFNALKKSVSEFSLQDRQKLFELNARKLYKLED